MILKTLTLFLPLSISATSQKVSNEVITSDLAVFLICGKTRKQYPLRCSWEWQTPSPVHILSRSSEIVYLAAQRIRRCRARDSFRYIIFHLRNRITHRNFTVGEDEEVSIKEVADAIVKAVGFKGSYTVSRQIQKFITSHKSISCPSLTPVALMANSANQLQTRNCCRSSETSNSRHSKRVSTSALCLFKTDGVLSLALDESVKWFLKNYDNARIGKVPSA